MTVTLDIGIYISESMHHRVVSHSLPKHWASPWWNEMDGDGMNEAGSRDWARLWFLIIISSSPLTDRPGLGLTSISLSYGNFKPKHRQTVFPVKYDENQVWVIFNWTPNIHSNTCCCRDVVASGLLWLQVWGIWYFWDNLHTQHSS